MQDETATAEQMVCSHGRAAALYASETATALSAMGDPEGAARWRRIRDIILRLATEVQDGLSGRRA